MQLTHVVLYGTLAFLWGVQAFKQMPECAYPMEDPTATYMVNNHFHKLFLTGFFTYLLDAIFRLIIAIGIWTSKFPVQLAGVTGTVLVATCGQTGLLLIIPIFRYNSAGIACSEVGEPLEAQG